MHRLCFVRTAQCCLLADGAGSRAKDRAAGSIRQVGKEHSRCGWVSSIKAEDKPPVGTDGLARTDARSGFGSRLLGHQQCVQALAAFVESPGAVFCAQSTQLTPPVLQVQPAEPCFALPSSQRPRREEQGGEVESALLFPASRTSLLGTACAFGAQLRSSQPSRELAG